MTKAEILAKLQADREAIAALKANSAADQATIASLTEKVAELQASQDNAEVDGDIANAVNDVSTDLNVLS